MMKKLILSSMIAVSAIFTAPAFAQGAATPATVPANASALLKLIPADSQVAASCNGSAIVNSKVLNTLAQTFTGKSIIASMQENDVTADDLNCVVVASFKFADLNAKKFEIIGGIKYYKNNAKKLFDEMIKGSKEDLAKNKVKGSLQELTIDGRRAVALAGNEEGNAFAVLFILVSSDTIQFRLGIGDGVVPEKKLIPALGTPCKLASSLNLRDPFSIVVDMEQVKKSIPAELLQENPILGGLSFVALAVEETPDTVKAKLDITTTTVDVAPMYQMQAAQLLEMFKQNPETKAIADAVTLKLSANVLTIQAAIPINMLMKQIAEVQKAAAGLSAE